MFLGEFGVARLGTLYLSTDLLFNVSIRCNCQWIYCSESGNIVSVNKFGVECLETVCLSADLVFRVWKRYVS